MFSVFPFYSFSDMQVRARHDTRPAFCCRGCSEPIQKHIQKPRAACAYRLRVQRVESVWTLVIIQSNIFTTVQTAYLHSPTQDASLNAGFSNTRVSCSSISSQ
jgi:hypothetical protein